MSCSVDVKLAESFARKAHAGTLDKSGSPYIDHPRRVAERLNTDEEKVVGWLHDVVEDTVTTLTDIAFTFGEETAAAVDAITHRKGESWSDYLIRVKVHPIAKAVKISDLTDNINLGRLPRVTEKDVRRAEKYIRALYFLMELDGE